MSTVIYYFTGTGNSLVIAKKIATALGETELVPVASFCDTTGHITPGAERVGIVFPVYFIGLPAMLASFASRLRFRNEKYIFAVCTFGGTGAAPALQQLNGILRQNTSRGLDAGFKVKMPGNYILMYESPKGEKRAKMLATADKDIARVAEAALQCQKAKLPRSFFGEILHILFYHRFFIRVHGEDQKFTVSERCNSCGTCVAVCPAKNIELFQNKPVFQHRCELCCGCIHNCPVQAIQVGKKTERWQRYRNPDVTVAELKLREKF
ncbi:MAG TPA: EFR1 family ferrodoxin [Methanospirillum sp.]|uniref:EFR1 family ferrodoxin n=1 Tax=Methanospirillum sp. TaxID=45200 RepID=UPI002B6ADF88|nr:EFR1 family ferrodoxin [Methanospirillum sp.]HWQ64608.1 EFR1 family ferrodoxin [Methanospirillum sp.]